jgi:hypothetical protein
MRQPFLLALAYRSGALLHDQLTNSPLRICHRNCMGYRGLARHHPILNRMGNLRLSISVHVNCIRLCHYGLLLPIVIGALLHVSGGSAALVGPCAAATAAAEIGDSPPLWYVAQTLLMRVGWVGGVRCDYSYQVGCLVLSTNWLAGSLPGSDL